MKPTRDDDHIKEVVLDFTTDELIMRSGTIYSRQFTNGVTANTINFKATWCEHTDV